MHPLPNDRAIADDYDDIVSSQDDTWSRQNHGAQATKPRKRGISNPTAPPPKVRQRKTNMEKCARYEYETASMTVAAQQVVNSSTLKDTGPSAREKELEARAALLQKTAMAKMGRFLKLNSDWMSLSSDLGGLSISDSKAQCSNDPKDLMTQVGLFSAAIADRSSTIQHYKQKGDRDRKTVSELRKELDAAGPSSKQAKGSQENLDRASSKFRQQSTEIKRLEELSIKQQEDNDIFQKENLCQKTQIESLEKNDKRSASRIDILETDLQQKNLDLVSANSEIGVLKSSLTSKDTDFSEAMHRLRDLERSYRKQERELDSLRELEDEKDKAKRLQDDLRHKSSKLQSTQSELERSRASATASAEKISELRREIRELKSATDEAQTDKDNILSEKMYLEKDRDSLLSGTATLEKERDGLLSEKTTLQEERDGLIFQRTILEEERASLLSKISTLQEETSSLHLQRTNLQGERAHLVLQRDTFQKEKESLEKEKLDHLMESQRGQTDLLAKVEQAKRQKEDVLSQRDELKVHIAEKASELEEQKQMALSLQISLESSNSEFADSRQCIMALIPLIFDQISRRRIISTQLRRLANRMESTTLENQHHLAKISALNDQVQSERAALRKLPKCNRFFYQKMWWLMFEFGDRGGFECVCLKDDLPKEVRKRLMGALEEKLPPEDVLVALEEKHVGSVIL